MRRMKKRGPHVLYDLNDLLFSLQFAYAGTARWRNKDVGLHSGWKIYFCSIFNSVFNLRVPIGTDTSTGTNNLVA